MPQMPPLVARLQIWTPNVLSTVIWCCAILTREETKNSIFCKPLKLLSPCILFSLFTFAPRFLFYVARATAYQAGHYTAEMMQVDDTTWQLKHRSRKDIILWTSPFRTNFVKEWFWLISGINIALLSVEDSLHWGVARSSRARFFVCFVASGNSALVHRSVRQFLDAIKQTKNRARILLATPQCRLALTLKSFSTPRARFSWRGQWRMQKTSEGRDKA